MADDPNAAELATLRERAYGPGSDIAGDPAALARLEELERRAHRGDGRSGDPASAVRPDDIDRPARHRPAETDAAAAVLGPPAAVLGPPAAVLGPPAAVLGPPPAGRDLAPEPDTTPPRLGRSRLHLAAIGVVAAMAVGLGGVGAASSAVPGTGGAPTADGTPTVVATPDGVLIRIPVGRSFVGAADGREWSDPPLFPVAEDMRWSSPIGLYYGWEVWLGRSRSNYPCVAALGPSGTVAECIPPDAFGQGGVSITLAFDDISPEERPPEMTPGDALSFRWIEGDVVQVEVGPAPAPGSPLRPRGRRG